MLRQFLVGGAASLVNIIIHALITTLVIQVAQAMRARKRASGPAFLIMVMVPTLTILMMTHIGEVIIWSVVYDIFDAAPPGANLVYFAFVNFATLGYGDIVPSQRWLLLGPLTAMNGALLFGWSTAVIFEVLRKSLTLIGSISEE